MLLFPIGASMGCRFSEGSLRQGSTSLNFLYDGMLHVAQVFEQAGEFDLILNQADFVPLAFSRLVGTPMVKTIHGFSSGAHSARFQGISSCGFPPVRASRPATNNIRR